MLLGEALKPIEGTDELVLGGAVGERIDDGGGL